VTGKGQIQPQYAEAFQCIGNECTDSCCVGWQVSIDRQTYEKYQTLPDLLPILNAKTTLNPDAGDRNYARINMEANRCPFLSEDRLCSIQKAHGAEYLCRTCAEFPRAVRVDCNVTKKTLMMSCPEAARIVLLNPNLLSDEEVGGGTHARYKHFLFPKSASSPKGTDPLDALWKLQRFSVVLLTDRRYPMWQRLFILGMFCSRLHELSVTQQANQAPALLDNYAQLIVNKRLLGLMGKIQARPGFQLDVTCKFVGRALQLTEGSSFRESLADFRAGIPFTGDIADQSVLAAYDAARSQFYAPLMQTYPHLLENYLTNYILQRGFLALNPADRHAYDLPTEYFVMCTHFVVIKTMLIGIAGHYREQFGTQHVVKLVQGFSKAAEHNLAFMDEVAGFIKDSGLNRPGQMATLLE